MPKRITVFKGESQAIIWEDDFYKFERNGWVLEEKKKTRKKPKEDTIQIEINESEVQ